MAGFLRGLGQALQGFGQVPLQIQQLKRQNLADQLAQRRVALEQQRLDERRRQNQFLQAIEKQQLGLQHGAAERQERQLADVLTTNAAERSLAQDRNAREQEAHLGSILGSMPPGTAVNGDMLVGTPYAPLYDPTTGTIPDPPMSMNVRGQLEMMGRGQDITATRDLDRQRSSERMAELRRLGDLSDTYRYELNTIAQRIRTIDTQMTRLQGQARQTFDPSATARLDTLMQGLGTDKAALEARKAALEQALGRTRKALEDSGGFSLEDINAGIDRVR